MKALGKVSVFLKSLVLPGLFFSLALPHARAQLPEEGAPCNRLLQGAAGSNPKKVEELPALFARGLLPAPSAPEQLDLFEFYRILYFGDPLYDVPLQLDREVMDALLAHPNLRKEPFRNFELVMERKVYPVTDSLQRFTTAQKMALGQSHARLFRILENPKPWKEILQYRPDADGAFPEFLKKKVPSEFQEPLHGDHLFTGRKRALELYRFLQKQPETPARNQAMVDLVHSIGYHDPAVKQALVSKNGMDRLDAYREILSARDAFARALGFSQGFSGLLQRFRVDQATGTHSESQIQATLAELNAEVVRNAGAPEITRRTIRHLSLMESPFRGCLGGDCSTRLYPKLGLDPDFHFFTITDQNGRSSGQVTVVLGSGTGPSGAPVSVAFLDKIQGVSEKDVAPMIEGIRRAMAEKGFVLVLPLDLGLEPLAISNQREIVNALPGLIRVGEPVIQSFFPRPTVFPFRDANEEVYSRAFLRLDCREVLPMRDSGPVSLVPGETIAPWSLAELSSRDLLGSLASLKQGDARDQVKYIVLMDAMRLRTDGADPEFERNLENWIRDPSVDFKVRKQALITLWMDPERSLVDLLDHFPASDQAVLIQNLLDTPRYLEEIEHEELAELSALLARFRYRPAIAGRLINLYLKGTPYFADFEDQLKALLLRIVSQRDVTDAGIMVLLMELRPALISGRSLDFVAILQMPWHPAVRAGLLEMATGYLFFLWEDDPFRMERGLSQLFFQESHEAFTLGRSIFERSIGQNSQTSGFSLLSLYREILNRAGGDGLAFRQRLTAWVRNPGVPVQEKVGFLMAMIGVTGTGFAEWSALIPMEQTGAVLEDLSKNTALPVFRAIAKKRGVEPMLLEEGSRESLEFQPVRGTAGIADFEVQRRTVTELQWRLVMGAGSVGKGSPLSDLWSESKLECPRISNVSWNDVQQFLKKLNAADERFFYRLPTKQEQDLLMKAEVPLAEKIGRFRAKVGGFNYSEWIHDVEAASRATASWKVGFRLIRTRK